ncbi:MAG: hypothetical protein N3F05_00730 [Candidatus Diapherotrites archaeon]|nr:hypothetical protein [Candidatus Diapherotrites archaeon]
MVQLFVPSKKDFNLDRVKPLEEKLNYLKAKVVEEEIQDDSISMFLYQFEKELEKAKSGDESALKRATLLADNIEQRLPKKEAVESADALEELRSKIKKPLIEDQKTIQESPLETDFPSQEIGAEKTLFEDQEKQEPKDVIPKEKISNAFEPIIEEKPLQKQPLQKTISYSVPKSDNYYMSDKTQKEVKSVFEEFASESKDTQTLTEEEKEEMPIEQQEVIARPILQEKKQKKEKKKASISIVSFDKENAEALFKNSIELITKAQLENGGITSGLSAMLNYIYPRSHLLSTLGLVYAGKYEEAKKALSFAIKGQNRHTGALPQRWDYHGNDASYRKVEPDCTALFLYAFAKYVSKSSDYEFAEHNWERIEKSVDFINSKIIPGKNLVLTPSSIHDYSPMDYGYEIWCNAVCCAALRELSAVADRIRLQYPPLDKQNLLRESIMSFMWNSRLNTFIKTIKVEDATSVITGPDASVLALSFFNVFPSNDERLKSTVDFTEKNLKYSALGGIMDYPPTYGQESSGVGASTFFTMLLADYHTSQNNFDEAKDYMQWILSVSADLKLPKYISTKEDFEALVSDLNDAGLIDRETLLMIEGTRKHPDYTNNIAHILEPYLPAHGVFLITWSHFREKFKDQL